MKKIIKEIKGDSFLFDEGVSFKVHWSPQATVNSVYFVKEVSSIQEANSLINTLAAYDLFLYSNNIRGDYANYGWIEVIGDKFENGESLMCDIDIVFSDNSAVNIFSYNAEDFLIQLNEIGLTEKDLQLFMKTKNQTKELELQELQREFEEYKTYIKSLAVKLNLPLLLDLCEKPSLKAT